MRDIIVRKPFRGRDATAFALSLPAVASIGFSWSAERRFRASMALIGVVALSVLIYVFAANSILLGGEAIRRTRETAKTLERERSLLEERVSQRRSPAWLTTESRRQGMVSIGTARRLTSGTTVSLSRLPRP